MESGYSDRLVGSEIHGFHTLQDLDVPSIMEESRTRWLRPNEIHAMLCNHKYFTINVKPVNLPMSGTIVFFDRKMLRNFRKDGHNWKKKKDGKTVKEAHEHLKVGNEERIHVYYAHGQDIPTFVRRCYWLLDKTLEHIVLVHYRETQEGSPATPVNSHSSSVSDQSAPGLLSEESDSGAARGYYAGEKDLELSGPSDSLTVINHAMRLHELNTLEWDDLLTNDPGNSILHGGDKIPSFDQQNQIAVKGSVNDGSTLSGYQLSAEKSALGNLTEAVVRNGNTQFSGPDNVYRQLTTDSQEYLDAQRKNSVVLGAGDSLDILINDGLQSQDSFGRWMNSIIDDSPVSVDDAVVESSISSGYDSFASPGMDQHQSSIQEQMFIITDFSPAWGFSNETTKILVTGYFHEQYLHLAKSNLFCICGDAFVPAEIVQAGVYSCMVSPHSPGLVNLCLSLDGSKPISQILNFEYRAPLVHDSVVFSEVKSKWEEFHLQMRLAYLLFSTSKTLNVLSSKVSPAKLKEAKKFAHRTSNISNSWAYLIKSIEDNRISVAQAKDGLFELSLKNTIKEWLLERVLEGCKTTEYDAQGLGVIHLCAIIGYTWAVYLFSWSGLSLDFRDKHGWTALHWAAYYGREKMVAALLSAGAKPNLVTDPTKENPGGCTAADLASAKGYDGLAAYLSEKALVAQFESMIIAGNASGSLQTTATDTVNSENLSEEELHLKDTLAAYRTAADAAARIQAAFREHSLKVYTKAVQSSSPEDEARNIIAAMKIQHAFRNYESKKKMAAAAHIQHRFRTWKMRKNFLNMRRQAIKIQAAFRGFQVRKQYRKIIWSVGLLEKAILRWRLKRKGFRGLQVEPVETDVDPKHESDKEEDFYKISQKQAGERVERSVIRVQAMFRSKQAQEQYRRMKLTYNQATVEYEGLLDTDMVEGDL
ncbi:PREDICTED: calmodulin-binding transcription activator 5 isoform X2 [Populus euphratica]|uniref:Calmodulin-binding transcription activator 5 isoform X2 n=1 Tax=Populus euphratica TaxID=75702 RepID=A0AAJ6XIL8_POPEU|nr:PREDICTED: calmodulin-binding transcription activator 5 isoform X2 [Populus euphratica]